MTALEYSTYNLLTGVGPGATGPLYFPLGPNTLTAGTVSIIQYMILISNPSVGATTATPFNYILYSCPNNTTLGPAITCAPQAPVASNQVITIIPQGTSYIVTNPYLAIDLNIDASGSFDIFYSVLQFPNGNILNDNFTAVSGTTISGTNTLITQALPYTTIIKSSNVMNLGVSPASFIFAYNNQNVSNHITLNPYEQATETAPIYCGTLPVGSNFGIYQIGSPNLNYYISATSNSYT